MEKIALSVEWCIFKPSDTWVYQNSGEGHEIVPPPASWGGFLMTPWFWTFSLQKCETINFCSFKSSNVWYFIKQSQGRNIFLKSNLGDRLVWASFITVKHQDREVTNLPNVTPVVTSSARIRTLVGRFMGLSAQPVCTLPLVYMRTGIGILPCTHGLKCAFCLSLSSSQDYKYVPSCTASLLTYF